MVRDWSVDIVTWMVRIVVFVVVLRRICIFDVFSIFGVNDRSMQESARDR